MGAEGRKAGWAQRAVGAAAAGHPHTALPSGPARGEPWGGPGGTRRSARPRPAPPGSGAAPPPSHLQIAGAGRAAAAPGLPIPAAAGGRSRGHIPVRLRGRCPAVRHLVEAVARPGWGGASAAGAAAMGTGEAGPCPPQGDGAANVRALQSKVYGPQQTKPLAFIRGELHSLSKPCWLYVLHLMLLSLQVQFFPPFESVVRVGGCGRPLPELPIAESNRLERTSEII